MYWAFDPDTGAILWGTLVGPGNTEGGIKWGSAVDANAIYVAIRNGAQTPFNLGPPANITGWRGGSWSALNPSTGAFLWQIPVPGVNPLKPNLPIGASGAMTVANGVVFAAALSGDLVALDALTGATLWTFDAGGQIDAAPAIVNGHVYWGTGTGTASAGDNKLLAFALPGQ
jgi:polyvinyl alcohol dehydrogenase (cytochrome)